MKRRVLAIILLCVGIAGLLLPWKYTLFEDESYRIEQTPTGGIFIVHFYEELHSFSWDYHTYGVSAFSMEEMVEKLLSGDVTTAQKYLGYNYFLEGTVVSGYQVGRKIGFPTANLRVDFSNKLIPSIGVYAVRVFVNGQQRKGILNIGHRPTLNNGTDLSIEVHILDFEGDIYNQPMRIEFIDFLRPEAKFQSVDELVLQIQKDKEAAIKMLEL